MSYRLKLSSCAICALPWMVSVTLAQDTRGTIAGRVADPSGAVVPGAKVTATHVATNTKTEATTNEQGSYLIPYLLPGTYQVTAHAAGFKLFTGGGIEVRVNDRLQFDIELELGSSTESVTVLGATPLLEAADASVGQVVAKKQLSELPILHSNPMLLMQLSPAAASTAVNMGFLDTRGADNARLTEYAIAGTPMSTHEVTLDGASNTTTAGGTANYQRTIAFVPPVDTVDEFRIEAAPYDAGAASSAGGQITINLKSGTNELHGSVRYFKTNPGWNANDFFANMNGLPRSYLNDRHWTVSMNGPVYLPKIYNGKNRTFIMYGYEWYNDDAPWAGGIFTVPTAKERLGDFSDLLKLGPQYQIYDPATGVLANGRINRQPFPGNILPANRISTAAKDIMNYYPAPLNAGISDGTQNYPNPNLLLHCPIWTHVGRIDHNFSEKFRTFFRGYFNNKDQQYRDYFDNLATGLINSFYNRGATLDNVYTLRPNLVVNFRYSYTRFIFPHTPKSQGMDLSTLGFPASFVNQIDRANTSFPQISISGMTNLGNEKPDDYITNTHHFSSTLNWVHGTHVLRFGVDYRVYQENYASYSVSSPSFSFGSSFTQGPLDNSPSSPSGVGQGLASFLLGLPTSGSIGRPANYAVSSPLLGLFAQDDWRLTPKLTVNIGLRYEYEGALHERFNRSVTGLDFTTVNPLNAVVQANYAKNPTPELPASQFVVKGGLLFAGVNGQPSSLFDTPKLNVAPRFGLAYKLDNKTAIRAGYGIFFGFVSQQSGDKVKQYGFSSTTPFQASQDGGLTFVASLDNPFPGGIVAPTGAAGGLNTYLGNSITFFPQHPVTPYNQRWSLTIQRQLPGAFITEVGYVGNRGTHLSSSNGNALSVDYRPFDPSYLSRSPVRDQAAINYWTAMLPNPFYPLLPNTGLSGSVISRYSLVQMANFPQFTGVSALDNVGISWYHALETRLERRFSSGYTVQVGYTFSKFMQAMSRLNGQLSPLEPVISDQDRPHRFTASAIYELPFGPKKKLLANTGPIGGRIIGGWQVEAIGVWQTGPPLGFGNALLVANVHSIMSSNPNVWQWFNPSAFDRVTADQLSYNYRTLPSLFSGVRAGGRNFMSASLIKAVPIRERLNGQLRAEFFNVLNHPNFAAPNTTPTSAAFGQVTSMTSTSRILQLALRVGW